MMQLHPDIARPFCLAMLLAVAVPAPAAAQDVKGSADHALISRFEGSTIIKYRAADFDEYRLVTKPINGYRSGDRGMPSGTEIDDQNSMPLEGRLTMITYEAPQKSSTLQILRSYQNALKSAGFETIFECTGRQCAGDPPPAACFLCGNWENVFPEAIMHRANMGLSGSVHENQRYLAARRRRPEGDVYVSLLVLDLKQPLTQLDIVEVKTLGGGLVTVDAATMAREIETTGSVSLYGIYFDTGRAEVKAESDPALQQISALMKQRPDLGLYVVGHTDNTGTFDTNRKLSEERARAVVTALVSRYGVTASRLTPAGVGPVAPVGSNATEKGRAQNRRVELVAR